MFGFRAALRRPVRLSHLVTFLSGVVCWNRDNSVLLVSSIFYSEQKCCVTVDGPLV